MALLVIVSLVAGERQAATAAVAASASVCVAVPGGVAGDVAVVNITNTDAAGSGWGALRSSNATPVYARPVADMYSSVNYAANTPPNPNLAFVNIGTDGKFCYDSAVSASDVILDLAAIIPATNITTLDPDRLIDTRNDDGGGSLLSQLAIAPQNTTVPYQRADWPHWIDIDGDCQDTRAEVLIRDSTTTVTFTTASNCTVATGVWLDPWTNLTFSVASDVDIDHTVALANAHRSGGWAWTTDQKRAFANDLSNLEALRPMDDGTNISKSDRGPEAWKPPATGSWCDYATDWATIKARWSLTVTTAEHDALGIMFQTCGAPPPPATTTTTTTIPSSSCDPSYPTVCIPPPPPDLNCADIPYRNFTVLQPDPHRFDGNKDGIGCTT